MRGRYMSVALAVILLSGVVMMTACGSTKETQIQTESEEVVTEVITSEVDDATDKVIDKSCEEYFEKAKHFTVEKVDRMTVDDLDGNSKTEYSKYLVSDVDVDNHTDDTSDYAKALTGDVLDDSLVEKTSFSNAFGFSCDGKSAWEVLEELLKASGFDQNINDATLDEAAYELTGQNIYVVNEQCSVLDELLDGIRYDELVESKVFYQTRDIGNDIVVPDCITAVVQYRIGDETFAKTVFLQVAVNDFEANGEE